MNVCCVRCERFAKAIGEDDPESKMQFTSSETDREGAHYSCANCGAQVRVVLD